MTTSEELHRIHLQNIPAMLGFELDADTITKELADLGDPTAEPEPDPDPDAPDPDPDPEPDDDGEGDDDSELP